MRFLKDEYYRYPADNVWRHRQKSRIPSIADKERLKMSETTQKNGKTMTTNAAFQKMDKWINETNEFPKHPVALLKLMKMTNDVATFSSDLVKELAQDQKLAEQIVQISRVKEKKALTGTIKASDIQRSIQRLGYELVQNEVEISLLKRYSKVISRLKNFKLLSVWKQSLRTALIAKELSKLSKYDSYEMSLFLGMNHKIGKIVTAFRDPKAFEEIEELIEQGHSEKGAELIVLGFDHNIFGAKLLRAWGAPEKIVNIVKTYNDLEQHDTELNRIFKFASFIASSIMDKNNSASSMWYTAQEHLKKLGIDYKFEEWQNKVNSLFIKILEIEDRVLMQQSLIK